MFTGIIRELGVVQKASFQGKILKYVVKAPQISQQTELGASIAINGICQTVTSINSECLGFDAIDETLSKTNLHSIKNGSIVHLEPALTLQQPLDGHLVYGHVDGVGVVSQIQKVPGRFDLSIRLPKNYEKYVLKGGSITLDGVSLTVFKCEQEVCSVSLIPETLDRTTFSHLRIGDSVNVEVDVIGKWLEKWALGTTSHLNFNEKLKQWGY
jgi:riboflavin synthase